MIQLTLARQHSPLSDPGYQLGVLGPRQNEPRFESLLAQSGLWPLTTLRIEVLQVNVGRVCNQTCRHCHVDAGPDRRESMSREVADACLAVLAATDIPTLDITGGAPEMNPHFRHLVEQGRRLGRRVMDRSNLTILVAPGYDDLPDFLAQHQVEVVASLPCYLAENTDAQRGDGVFDRSIEALRRLNALGYGTPGGSLQLTLVYNPLGLALPPAQETLEAAYRRELAARYGVVFNRLITITNMPISRFLDDLVRHQQRDAYLRTLIDAYNPAAAVGVMCRTMLSVGWDGRLFDCDFNQMLDLELADGLPRNICDFDLERLVGRRIVTGQHCFGCTAGCGSGCRGAIAPASRQASSGA
jgi:radical SAM/Cys-rich protein